MCYDKSTLVNHIFRRQKMQLELGNNIRQLRRWNHKTQENLAEALGVTSQAVSRWESGGSYPDMNLIPSIANFFGISIDELFGYKNDREQRIDALATEIDRMNNQNDGQDVCITECIALARSALVEFPGNEKLMVSLASALFKAGYVRYGEHHVIDADGYNVYDTKFHHNYTEWNEAVILYEKVLKTLPYGKLRDRVTKELVQLYLNLGEYEKGKLLAETAPSMWNSQEFLYAHVYDGKQGVQATSETLLKLIHACAQLMVNITINDQQHLSVKEKANNIASAIRLFELVCPDGNYGSYHSYIVSLELQLSLYLWLDHQQDAAFTALNRAKENGLNFISICEDGVVHYTAPFVRLVEEKTICDAQLAREAYETMAENWPWWNIPEAEQVKKEMQADSRWAAWVASTQL